MDRIKNISNQLVDDIYSQPIKKHTSLKGKTIVITGASRGIGLAIARSAALDGANIAILAKTAEPHPKLEGTIFTAAKELETLGAQVLPLKCDIRYEEDVKRCVEEVIKRFGGIDILINNASAISITNTEDTSMKKYDLMNQVNSRGTYMMTKYCLPYLIKSTNPHVLMLSPPLLMEPKWIEDHVAYTIAKYGMSMCVVV